MTSYHHCSPRYFEPNPTISLRDANSFNLILVSADNLPYYPRWSGRKMEVYAEVSLDGGAAKRSDVDCQGETNPTWKFEVNFPVTESTRKTGGNLVVNLYCKRSCRLTTFIGAVKIKVESIFQKWLECEKCATENVEKTPDGRLTIKYDFQICG